MPNLVGAVFSFLSFYFQIKTVFNLAGRVLQHCTANALHAIPPLGGCFNCIASQGRE